MKKETFLELTSEGMHNAPHSFFTKVWDLIKPETALNASLYDGGKFLNSEKAREEHWAVRTQGFGFEVNGVRFFFYKHPGSSFCYPIIIQETGMYFDSFCRSVKSKKEAAAIVSEIISEKLAKKLLTA